MVFSNWAIRTFQRAVSAFAASASAAGFFQRHAEQAFLFLGPAFAGRAGRQFLFGGHVGPGLAPMLPYLAAPAFKAGKLLEIGFLLGGGPLRPAGHNFLAAPGQFRNQILAQHLIEFIRKVRRQHERQLGLGPGFLVDAHLQRLEPDFVFGGDNFGEDFFGYRKLGSRRLFVLGGFIGGTRSVHQHGRVFAGLGEVLGTGTGFGASRK
ncbi:MAG: hypothetical protein VB959_03815 [Rhodospirillales bacterium]